MSDFMVDDTPVKRSRGAKTPLKAVYMNISKSVLTLQSGVLLKQNRTAELLPEEAGVFGKKLVKVA